MDGYHSVMSRRDFMKRMGVAGAGIGAASLVAPVYHDLDEMAADAEAKHPTHGWFVKEREVENPTTEIDWSVWKAYDAKINPMAPDTDIRKTNLEGYDARNLDGLKNKNPGFSLRDIALTSGLRNMYGTDCPWDGVPASNVQTPEARGTSVWQDTPENNLQSIRAAMHLAGCNQVGAIVLTDRLKQKLFDAGTTVFEDIPKGFLDKGIYHIPNSCKYMLVFSAQQNFIHTIHTLHADEGQRGGYGWSKPLSPHAQGYATSAPFYFISSFFMRNLGYQTYRPPVRPNVAMGVLAGIGEQGRVGNIVSPNRGMLIRMTYCWVTDFPLAPTKPVDFGILKFCENCKTCARSCPSEAVSMETEPSWDTKGITNNPGVKHWYMDWQKCRDWGSPGPCGNCQACCPFNTPSESLIHQIVRYTAGKFAPLDSFYSTMEKQFGYADPRSDEEVESWWARNLNSYKSDTILNSGTYKWW